MGKWITAEVLAVIHLPISPLGWLAGKRLVLIIAPVGDAPSSTYTCGICGFVMDAVGDARGAS